MTSIVFNVALLNLLGGASILAPLLERLRLVPVRHHWLCYRASAALTSKSSLSLEPSGRAS